MTKRICLWSGPRNVSTALMYSFAQRSDTQVVDEPLYAHYLKRTNLVHPGREEILADQEQEGAKVVAEILGPWERPVVFFKQMAHHLLGLDLHFLTEVTNIFLIRSPGEVLNSFSKVIERPRLADIGIQQQAELYQQLVAQGQTPLVVDGPELLKNPTQTLRQLCAGLDLPFEPQMLNWEAGARPEDGIWAKYWYHSVHQSTGFAPYQARDFSLSQELLSVWEAAQPYYEMLFAQRIHGGIS